MPCEQGFLCFNCKPRLPAIGRNRWEIAITVVNICLLILSLSEIVAFANYAQVFSSSTANACCGLIEEKTFPLEGAVCDERDIVNGRIEMDTFNNSRLCVVNNIICEEYNYHDQGNSSTLEDCLNRGGFALSDVCGTDILDEAASYDTVNVAIACIVICVSISATTFAFICEWIGCFENSCWCKNRFVRFVTKLMEIAIWVALLVVSTMMVENTAANGYRNTAPDGSLAEEWIEDMCEIERDDIIWITFSLNLPDWLASTAWNIIAYFGVALSVIEFLLFFKVFFASDKTEKDTSTQGDGGETKTAKTDEQKLTNEIEMADKENITMETGDENGQTEEHDDDEKEAEYVTPGGDDMDGDGTEIVTAGSDGNDDHESDQDVLNDDDEKEAEYVTPQ